jgi:ubiquinone/menaquinone biosynthesis C-methylase UbiE
MSTPRDIENFNHQRFEHDYTVERLGILKGLSPDDYFRKLLKVKFGFVRKYGARKNVLDIGCGNGDFLFELKDVVLNGTGIDYTDKGINAAIAQKQSLGIPNLSFMKANARALPFDDGSFDVVYSFSALAVMPNITEVVKEMNRVLKKDGVAILELGNLRSLNTFVCNACPELAHHCHLTIKEMKAVIKESNFEVLEWRSFGIFPYWEERPIWLRPLLHPRWKWLFQKEVNGKMLDEWVCNIFLFKPWAYRHFLICQKG